jgi:hypothetical protein
MVDDDRQRRDRASRLQDIDDTLAIWLHGPKVAAFTRGGSTRGRLSGRGRASA